jgi:hypothetical protein
MLHVEDFIEIYCLSNNKTPRGMAERESATYSVLVIDIIVYILFIIQIYPHLYPQMTRSIELSY